MMNSTLRIADRHVGLRHPPFIIAEMSGNHDQSLEKAMRLVEAAAAAGAHAVKIQTYTAETMTLDLDRDEFVISDPANLWRGKSLFELYREAHTPWEWHAPIFTRCHELGLLAFSTPFDETAVDFLESLDVPCYKVASFENTDIPLIRKIAATRKPVLISTGMASVAELDEAVNAAREAGAGDIVLLKCTSSYPATPENSNLRTIPHMRQTWGCEVGLSDHTMGIGAAVAAVSMGATVIEKHFTFARADGGVDSAFSLEPAEFAALVVETRRAWQSLGGVLYGTNQEDKKSLVFRRSLYVAKSMRAGDVFTRENLRIIRPGLGLAPKYLDLFLGKRVAKDVTIGTPLNWELLLP
jgi:pseudaminic acid synthase